MKSWTKPGVSGYVDLKVGDLLVLTCQETEGYYGGMHISTNECGWFPVDSVVLHSSDGAASPAESRQEVGPSSMRANSQYQDVGHDAKSGAQAVVSQAGAAASEEQKPYEDSWEVYQDDRERAWFWHPADVDCKEIFFEDNPGPWTLRREGDRSWWENSRTKRWFWNPMDLLVLR